MIAAAFAAAATVIFAGTAGAVQPPNPKDPCAKAGRDVCGTTGVGFYKTYQYGLRWFGDYTGVVAGASRSFCIDLGYWYPSAKDKYAPDDTTGLRTSQGKAVSLLNREKLAYAVWAYGRSSNPDREAAVMLYVHSLMGDARPGEVDPAAIGPNVASIDRQIAADSDRFHGPYRLSSSLAGPLKAGQPAGATIRILAASGAAMPDLQLKLTSTGSHRRAEVGDDERPGGRAAHVPPDRLLGRLDRGRLRARRGECPDRLRAHDGGGRPERPANRDADVPAGHRHGRRARYKGAPRGDDGRSSDHSDRRACRSRPHHDQRRDGELDGEGHA